MLHRQSLRSRPHRQRTPTTPVTGDPGCPHFGHLVCEQIDNGLSPSQVAENAMAAYDLTKIMAASLVAGAIVTYCPWDEGN